MIHQKLIDKAAEAIRTPVTFALVASYGVDKTVFQHWWHWRPPGWGIANIAEQLSLQSSSVGLGTAYIYSKGDRLCGLLRALRHTETYWDSNGDDDWPVTETRWLTRQEIFRPIRHVTCYREIAYAQGELSARGSIEFLVEPLFKDDNETKTVTALRAYGRQQELLMEAPIVTTANVQSGDIIVVPWEITLS